ncbi:unnamed protein product, partial [Phaeothamnion confervicola]
MLKLLCEAATDRRSYSTELARIGAGRFGHVVAVRAPLPPLLPPAKAKMLSTASALANRCGPSPCGCGTQLALKIVPRSGDGSRGGGSNGNGGSSGNGGSKASTGAATSIAGAISNRWAAADVFSEISALQRLRGVAGACQLVDFGVDAGAYLIVTQRCGRSVREWRAARAERQAATAASTAAAAAAAAAAVSEADVDVYVGIWLQVARAVEAMAACGIVHFDLKCDNILLKEWREDDGGESSGAGGDGSGRGLPESCPAVCVADFGEAVLMPPSPLRRPPWAGSQHESRDAADTSAAASSAPQMAIAVTRARGMECIQAPEMLRLGISSSPSSGSGSGSSSGGGAAALAAANAIGAPADVWSLGCLLFETVTGEFLFDTSDWAAFFVTVAAHTGNSGISDDGGDGGGGGKGAQSLMPSPRSPLPPPARLQCLEHLQSLPELRDLMAGPLRRHPAARPSAAQVAASAERFL